MQKENKNINQLVILNLIQDLRRWSWSLHNSVRGRFRIKYETTPLLNNSAFTLIEILVVILIIAILAAIALPQYQKAVDRARFAQLQAAGDALVKAHQLYVLETGDDSPTTFEKYINLPGTLSKDKKRFSTDDWDCYFNMFYKEFICKSKKYNLPYWMYFWPTKTQQASKKCRGYNDRQKEICVAAGAKLTSNNPGYYQYTFP